MDCSSHCSYKESCRSDKQRKKCNGGKVLDLLRILSEMIKVYG